MHIQACFKNKLPMANIVEHNNIAQALPSKFCAGANMSPRTGMGPLWVNELNRSMSMAERMECMGWSTEKIPGAIYTNPERATRKLYGNQMHLFSVAAMLATMLACTAAPPWPYI